MKRKTAQKSVLRSSKENMSELRHFCKTHNRFPVQHRKDPEERSLAGRISYTKCNYPQHAKEIEKLRSKYGNPKKSPEETMAELRHFCKTHNKTPSQRSRSLKERSLYVRIANTKSNYPQHAKEIDRLRSKYGNPKKSPEEIIAELRRFCKTNNRFPSYSRKDLEERSVAIRIANTKRNHPQHAKAIEQLHLKYGNPKKSPEETMAELRHFCKTHNRLPSRHSKNSKESRLCIRTNNTKYKYLHYAKVIAKLRAKYKAVK